MLNHTRIRWTSTAVLGKGLNDMSEVKDILIIGGGADDLDTLLENTTIINGGSAGGIDE